MAVKLHSVASVNGFSTTLNGAITASDETITLTLVTGLPAGGGIFVIDRINASGTATPETREYVSYAAVAGMTVTGASRGLASSTAQAHSSGAIVEEVWSVTHVLDLIDFLNVAHNNDGTIKDESVFNTPTLNDPILDGDLSGTGIDTDETLAANSDTIIASQKAVKTYINTPRVVALTDEATPALDASLGNVFTLNATGNRTIAVPSNPTNGQKIVIVHYASGGARTLALNTGAGGFAFGADITALEATTSGKYDHIGCIYNSTANKWFVVAVSKGY